MAAVAPVTSPHRAPLATSIAHGSTEGSPGGAPPGFRGRGRSSVRRARSPVNTSITQASVSGSAGSRKQGSNRRLAAVVHRNASDRRTADEPLKHEPRTRDVARSPGRRLPAGENARNTRTLVGAGGGGNEPDRPAV